MLRVVSILWAGGRQHARQKGKVVNDLVEESMRVFSSSFRAHPVLSQNRLGKWANLTRKGDVMTTTFVVGGRKLSVKIGTEGNWVKSNLPYPVKLVNGRLIAVGSTR
jgi:hypothetical protein